MSDFETELRFAKNRAAQIKTDQVKAAEAEKIRRESEHRLRQELFLAEAREEYERVVEPLRTMVDRLMDGLGNETWGRGNYKKRFWSKLGLEGPLLYPTEERKPASYQAPWGHPLGDQIASWMVYQPCKPSKSAINVPPHAEYYYSTRLKAVKGEFYFFHVDGRPHQDFPLVTSGIDEAELRDLLTARFLSGPLLNYPSGHEGGWHGALGG